MLRVLIRITLSLFLFLFRKYWNDGLEPSSCIVETIGGLATALRGSFQKYLAVVLPRMTGCLASNATPDHTAAAILRFFQSIGPQLREWAHSAVPAILHASEHCSTFTRNLALSVLLSIASSTYLGFHLSRILPVLVRLTKQPSTADQATRTFCGLVKECGPDALAFALSYERSLGFAITGHPQFLEYAEGSASEGEGRSVQRNQTLCGSRLTLKGLK